MATRSCGSSCRPFRLRRKQEKRVTIRSGRPLRPPPDRTPAFRFPAPGSPLRSGWPRGHFTEQDPLRAHAVLLRLKTRSNLGTVKRRHESGPFHAALSISVIFVACGSRTGLDGYGGPEAVGGGSSSGPPSCEPGGPGMTNCGASGETCCASLEVQGGTYFRTYNYGSSPTAEADPATLSTFRLDKYLVTVGRFRRFVNAWNGGSGWTPVARAGKHVHLNGGAGLANSGAPGTYETGWVAPDDVNVAPTDVNLTATCEPYATWTPTAAGKENLPIICVDWFEAYAFCIWDGGFLPSEAEWEYAAAGGRQQRLYPWGAASPGTDNQHAIYGCFYPHISP